MAAENESGFEIDGEIYEVPTIDSFDMDEAQVLYDYSGLTIEDFVEPENDEEAERRAGLFKNPAFVRSLMHISYQRKHAELKQAKVRELIGKCNLIGAMTSLVESLAEGDESPLASTTEHGQSSPSDSVVSSTSSGPGSTTGSEQPDSQPETTGTGRSDTSSPVSPPTLSVA